MPVYQLPPHNEDWFPPPSAFDPGQDIVAVGGDLHHKRLRTAYRSGIFPWFNPGEEILWWCPQKRMVLKPHEVHISKSSRNLINQQRYTFKRNFNFEAVIERCQKIKRKGQRGTWLSNSLKHNFIQLHLAGMAHSLEAYRDDKLVGGLYGIAVGGVFTGESMFSEESNASKLCFMELCRHLQQQQFLLIDCQVYNPYLASLGAYEIERSRFLKLLAQAREMEEVF